APFELKATTREQGSVERGRAGSGPLPCNQPDPCPPGENSMIRILCNATRILALALPVLLAACAVDVDDSTTDDETASTQQALSNPPAKACGAAASREARRHALGKVDH